MISRITPFLSLVLTHSRWVALGLLGVSSYLKAEPPTSLGIEPKVISENAPAPSVAGDLTAIDQDSGGNFTFELVTGEGDQQNGLFLIQGSKLLLQASPDFEVLGPGLKIRVKVTDSSLESMERSFILTLTDDRAEDADHDGISEADEEDIHGSSDTAYDSDGDGFGDAYEISRGYLPGDPNSHPPGALVIGWGKNDSGQTAIPPDLGEVVAIAAGNAHSLALRCDGTVVAWGGNDAGQCDVPENLTGIVAIGAGDRHSLAVTADGHVIGWGANDFGQATAPEDLENVVAVAGGGRHTLALKRDGRIRVWGADDFFQSTPPLNLTDVVSISATLDQCMVVFSNGKVRTWGRDNFNQSTTPEGLSLASGGASGERHSLMLRRDGIVVGWGSNTDGQLAPPAGLNDAIAISSRGRHNLAIRRDGNVIAWGLGDYGQTTPPFEARNARMIAAGADHSLVLRQNEDYPAFSSPSLMNGRVGTELSHQLTVVNATVSTYSAMFLPEGLALDPLTGLISGTLLNDERRSFRVFAHSDKGMLSQLIFLSFGDEHPPTDIILSSDTILENAPAGTVAAILTAIDPDLNSTHIFELISGEGDQDNYRFFISGNQLLVRYGIDVDFEKPHVPFSIRIRATDSAASPFQASLKIEMLDDRTEDFDGDGLSEADEEDLHGTSDSNYDKDGDGINDGAEVLAGNSPLDANDWPDHPVAGWGANPTRELIAPLSGGVVSLSLGQRHGLAIGFDGRIVSWAGLNTYGQRDIPTDVGDVVAVAAGGDGWIDDSAHSLALRRDGTVIAWGCDIDGQATVPEGLSGVVAVSAGRDHSVALKSDGTVVAWGHDFLGETLVPPALSDVVAISAGGMQTLALRKDGTVVGWGSYFDGVLWKPTFVPDGLLDVVAVSAGRHHCLALRRDGTVIAWGNGDLGQTTVPAGLTGVTAIAAGGFHSLALKADGSVAGWGLNDHGQSNPPGPALQNVQLIAAGFQHSIVIRNHPGFPEITSSREIPATVDEPLGFQVTVANATPTLYSAIGLPTGFALDPLSGLISGVTATPVQTLIRIEVDTDKGRLVQNAWLSATSGASPATIGLAPSEIRENAAAGTVIGVLSSEDPDEVDSHLFQLVAGDGSEDNASFRIIGNALITSEGFTRDFEADPAPLSIRVRVTDATLNHHEQVLLVEILDDRNEDSDGDGLTETQEEDLYGTSDTLADTDGDGFGDRFEVARGTSPLEENEFPTGTMIVSWGSDAQGPGTPLPPGELIDIDAGHHHTLGLYRDGSITAWGANTDGQSSIPEDLPRIVAVAAGGNHSLLLAADGTVQAWGRNAEGQCDVPEGLTGVIAIAAGETHSMALKADGTIVAWGGNLYGQSAVPGNLSEVIAISAGAYHSIALRNDGTVTAWGYDGSGICEVPGAVIGIVGISAGAFHNLALKSDGKVIGWGFNGHGQTSVPETLSDATQVSAGESHSLALRSDGSVVSWGDPANGKTAVPIEAKKVRSISAGGSVSLALRTDLAVPEISAESRVRASVGSAISHPVIVDGATPTEFRAFGLPTGLFLDTPTGLQQGTISTGEVRSVLLIAETDQGRLKRILPYNTIDGLPPTAIQLSATEVMENTPPGSFVASISATDPDIADTHVFSLVSGVGDSANYRFLVVGNTLTVRYGISVDYDVPHPDFSIRLRAVDSAGNEPYEQVFTIKLTDDLREDPDGDGITQATGLLMDWAEAGGLLGDDRLPAATPHGDGVANLIKYAFGLDPALSYQRPPETIGGLPIFTPATPLANGRLEYLRRKNRSLGYEPRSSSSLDGGSFGPLPEVPTIIRIDDDWEKVLYEFPFVENASARRFFVVEVHIP